jgi:hypothetical protein
MKHISTHVLLPVYEFVLTNAPVGGQWRSRFSATIFSIGPQGTLHSPGQAPHVKTNCRSSFTALLTDDRGIKPLLQANQAEVRASECRHRIANEVHT